MEKCQWEEVKIKNLWEAHIWEFLKQVIIKNRKECKTKIAWLLLRESLLVMRKRKLKLFILNCIVEERTPGKLGKVLPSKNGEAETFINHSVSLSKLTLKQRYQWSIVTEQIYDNFKIQILGIKTCRSS